MAVDSNGVYIPPTVEEINNDLQQQLLDAGVNLNVFDNSNYIQTTNPIVTKIYNLAVNIASFPDQIQKIFSLQNITIDRAGIFTRDAILNLLLDDEDITSADVRNFAAGEVTIIIYSTTADLVTKDYTELTQNIVNATSVFGVYMDLGSAVVDSALRPNSLELTTVYYNIATEIAVDTSIPLQTLDIQYSTFTPVDEAIENVKINDKMIEVFSEFKIGQELEVSFLTAKIFEVSSNYKSVVVAFSSVTPITSSQIYKYVDANIVLV